MVKSEAKEINADTIRRKINAMRNERLKLGLRLQLQSGLRVGEISDLIPEDIRFEDNGNITLNVRNGKGGKQRFVNIPPDDYLKKHLQAFMEGKNQAEKLFYAKDYIRSEARRYGIETHDLRRINSVVRYNEAKKRLKGKNKAKHEVKEQLGHTTTTMTNIYLKTKVKG